MSWATWALLGFAVGWLLHGAIFGPESSASPNAGWWARWWAHLAGMQPLQPRRRIFARIFGVLGLLFIVGFSATYGFFPKKAYGWDESVVRSRTPWILLCVCAGWWARDHRAAIGSRLQQLFDAFFGKSHESPGALQAALAIIFLFGMLIALRPELLDKITSFHAGDVEVKLGASSAKLREASINLKPSSLSNAIIQYDYFDLFNTRGNHK
jgi:hypothetical protein